MATLRAARDFGLDERSLEAIALRFDPRCPDVDRAAGELAEVLCRDRFMIPDAL